MSLAGELTLFHRLVTAPESVGKSLESLGIPGAVVDETFAGTASLPAVARLDLYADMYFFRLRDVLAEQFPRLAATVGPGEFHNLCVAYFAAVPSRSPSLRDLGDRLAGFVETSRVATAHPAAADLARLEWACLDLHDAADSELLDFEAIRALAPDRFASLEVALPVAHRLLWLRPEAVRAFDPASAGEVTTERSPCLVWRRGLEVRHRRVALDELEALGLAAGGTTLGALCELAAAAFDAEHASAALHALLTRWLDDGLLARPQVATIGA